VVRHVMVCVDLTALTNSSRSTHPLLNGRGLNYYPYAQRADGGLWLVVISASTVLTRRQRRSPSTTHNPEDPASISDVTSTRCFSIALDPLGRTQNGLDKFDPASRTFRSYDQAALAYLAT